MINGEGGNNQEPDVTLEGLQGQGGIKLPFEVNLDGVKIDTEPPKTDPPAPDGEGNPPNQGEGDNKSEYETTLALFNTDDTALSDEDKELKSSILEFFIGEKIDDKGNLVNKEGKIVLSSENLKKYIEENELPLDDKGNQVNDLGEVIKTREELDLEGSIVLSSKRALEQNFGFTLERNDYEDNETGIIELVQDAIKAGTNSSISKFLEANPEVKGYFLHLKTGGSPDNYKSQEVDYKSIQLDKLSDDEKLGYIKNLFSKKGLDSTPFIDLVKKAGSKDITEHAAKAILELDALQLTEKEAKEQEFKQQRIQQQEEEKKYWQTLGEIVNKGKLGNITIPISERQLFFDYISKPIDKEGNSADAIKASQGSEEFDLMVSYLRWKDFNIGKLAALIAREDKVESFRNRVDKLKGRKVESDGTRNTHSGTGNQPMTIEQMQGYNK